MLRGGCFCHAVRYEIDAEPTNQTICHCTSCRHAAGAPSVAWFSVPPGSVRFVAVDISDAVGIAAQRCAEQYQ